MQLGNNSHPVGNDEQNGLWNMEYLSTASGLLPHFSPTPQEFDSDTYKRGHGAHSLSEPAFNCKEKWKPMQPTE